MATEVMESRERLLRSCPPCLHRGLSFVPTIQGSLRHSHTAGYSFPRHGKGSSQFVQREWLSQLLSRDAWLVSLAVCQACLDPRSIPGAPQVRGTFSQLGFAHSQRSNFPAMGETDLPRTVFLCLRRSPAALVVKLSHSSSL